jgi:hypothetical protein
MVFIHVEFPFLRWSFCSRLPPLHSQPDPRRHPGVVEGAVVLPNEVSVREQVQVDCFQCVVGQAGEAEAAHPQRTEVAMREVHLQSRELVAEETDVECGVVGDEGAVRDEGVKAREDLLRRGLSFEHFVGDPMDRLHLRRDRDSGVDKRREFLRDGAVFDGDRADLDDPMAMPRRKPGCFEIDDHVPVERVHPIFDADDSFLWADDGLHVKAPSRVRLIYEGSGFGCTPLE